MSTSAQIPMIDQNGNAGMVDVDKAQAAAATGKYESAVKMIGPKGEQGYVAKSKVDSARSNQYAVSPDSGVPMVTPAGQMTYALPDEVDKFEQSGHTLIKPDGSFQVKPLEGEDNTDTMARAAKVAQTLTPEMKQKAMDAESKTFTTKRIAASLLAGPAIAATQLSGIGAAAEIPSVAAPVIARSIYAAGPPLARVAAKVMMSPVGQTVVKEGGKYAVKAAAGTTGYMLARKLYEALTK